MRGVERGLTTGRRTWMRNVQRFALTGDC
jgi:hypothetical protein